MPNYIEGDAILSDSDLSIFDAKFATNQFSGNQSLLVKILEKFSLQYQHFETELTEHLQQEELPTVKQQVHSLKGVSGNLGMMALHQACKAFERELSSQVTGHPIEKFLQIFKQTLIVIQDYSAKNASAASPEVAPQQDNKAELIAALKRNEFISGSKMQRYLQSLDWPRDKLDALQQAIDDLDYASAIALLG